MVAKFFLTLATLLTLGHGPITQEYIALGDERGKNALQLMREYRLDELKNGVPHSIWKLLEAYDEDDVIFEWYVPESSLYKESYHLERFVVTDYGYHKLAYVADKRPKEKEAEIAALKAIEIDRTGTYRDAPKGFA